MTHRRPRRAALPLIPVLASVVLSVGAAGATPAQALGAASPSPEGTIADASIIDGVFEVDAHGLYLNCRGAGSPTIVYLHGAIWETGFLPHANGEFAQRALSADHRVCVYDRRNVGLSETVDAPQSPDDLIGDLRGLLAAAGVEPPYVLLGASFGGLVAYLYVNAYPDEVVGMVLLDSMFPDELSLDDLFPPEERYEAFDAEDENESLERISHFKVMQTAQAYVGHEPAIPVTYLSSIPEGFDVNDFGIPEYDEQVMDLQEAYVERFSPGRYVRVDAPHFMEAAIPELIVEELRLLVEAATPQG
jgi:pimeloyl-ACP methyl ester carboxylesterase